MITICKESKTELVKATLFTIISVSDTLKPSGDNTAKVAQMPGFLPPEELRKGLISGDISKKEFKKKYLKFLKTDKVVEASIFNIGLAIDKAKRGYCFICSDGEWEIGYLKILAKYIEKTFGVTFSDVKDLNKTIEKELKELPKKERKGKKGKKALKKIIGEMIDETMTMNAEGKDYLNKLRKKFAVDQIMVSATTEGFCEFNGATYTVNSENLKKMEKAPFIKAIFVAADANKKYKKVIEGVFESQDLKLSKKKIKDLSKEQILHLCAQIFVKLNDYRYSSENED